MNKIKLLRELQKYPLFTFNDFVRETRFKAKYAKLSIFRLKKEKLIFEIERGKYTVFDDPMAFASLIITPSYISFWTSLKFYNLTEQLPKDIMIASSKTKKQIIFNKSKIQFFKTKNMWGYKKQRYEGFDIFIAEPEKAIIDSSLLKNVPFDEIIKAVKTKEFNADKLIEYAIRTGNKSLIKRLGLIMDYFGFNTEKLLSYKDNNYIVLDWNSKKQGKKNKKWKIIDNRRLDDID